MVKYGILSDTLINESNNTRANELIEKLKKIFENADYILHLGNVCTLSFLHKLEKIAPVRCIKGDIDEIEELKESIFFSFGPYNINMIHHPPSNLKKYILDKQIQILIHGHTCIPLIEGTSYNALILNPGSPTVPKAPPQKKGFKKPKPRPSVMILEINEKNYMLSTFLVNLDEKKSG
ncbi:MAG: metallophosphoesterase family protein [Promethearchaeota archaeon]